MTIRRRIVTYLIIFGLMPTLFLGVGVGFIVWSFWAGMEFAKSRIEEAVKDMENLRGKPAKGI